MTSLINNKYLRIMSNDQLINFLDFLNKVKYNLGSNKSLIIE